MRSVGGLVSIPRPMCFFLFLFCTRFGKKESRKGSKECRVPPQRSSVPTLIKVQLVFDFFLNKIVSLFKTLVSRVSTRKTHTSCDYVLNLPWKPIITQTMTNYPKLEDPDSVLVKEIQACLIFFYLRVPNLLAEG